MVLAICTILFCISLVPGQCRESCTTSSHMERMSRCPAEKFLCKWHQVTEKLLLSQLTTHWSLWLWGVKMLTCRKSSFYYFGLFDIAMLPEGDALFAALQCFYCGWRHVCSSLFGRSQQIDKNGLLSCRKQSKGHEGGMLRTVQTIDQWL